MSVSTLQTTENGVYTTDHREGRNVGKDRRGNVQHIQVVILASLGVKVGGGYYVSEVAEEGDLINFKGRTW